MSFVVRKLASSGLDGAFRVHLLPEHLDQTGLKLGDLCEISNENGISVGYGIAWRSAEKMGTSPKNRPVKMTETLQTAYNIKEGSEVMLYRTDAKVVQADEVVLSDITPDDYLENDPDDRENEKWQIRCIMHLANCDVFTSGITLDISAKKGLKRRYYVDHVKSSIPHQGAQSLYYFNDKSTITFNDTGSFQLRDDSTTTEEPLSESYIGGLQDQLERLNTRLKQLIGQTKASVPDSYNGENSILIHGFEGTGKSLILERLLESSPCRTFTLDKATLNAATTSKNAEIIHEIMKDARRNQPSLVLIEDINEIAPADDATYTKAIIQGLRSLDGTKVLVIATCRNPFDVNNRILADNFSENIELSVPDQRAREQILNIHFAARLGFAGQFGQALGARTHGFTGRDLLKLVKVALSNALYRLDKIHREPEPHSNGSVEGDLDGSTSIGAIAPNGDKATIVLPNAHATEGCNQAASSTSGTEERHFTVTVEDFDYALSKVRPAALKEIIFEPPKTTWSDIGGSQGIQESLDKIILYPQTHAKDMVSYSKIPKKGVLLYGPPGCSKTLTAQAIATKYGVNFIAIKGGELISMYVGESERSLRELFRKARAAKPCVIFFDEIDAIASARESGASKGLNVLTTLLNEMDGFDVLEGVLILAATNKPEALDTAIMRPGRFDAHFYLGLPDTSARSEILQIKAKGAPGADALDYNTLAEKTNGYTGAELAKVYDLATDLALERKINGGVGAEGDGRLRMDDFDYGIEHTRRGVDLKMLKAYDAFRMKAAEG